MIVYVVVSFALFLQLRIYDPVARLCNVDQILYVVNIAGGDRAVAECIRRIERVSDDHASHNMALVGCSHILFNKQVEVCQQLLRCNLLGVNRSVIISCSCCQCRRDFSQRQQIRGKKCSGRHSAERSQPLCFFHPILILSRDMSVDDAGLTGSFCVVRTALRYAAPADKNTFARRIRCCRTKSV